MKTLFTFSLLFMLVTNVNAREPLLVNTENKMDEWAIQKTRGYGYYCPVSYREAKLAYEYYKEQSNSRNPMDRKLYTLQASSMQSILKGKYKQAKTYWKKTLKERNN